jgi:hypothetical protein
LLLIIITKINVEHYRCLQEIDYLTNAATNTSSISDRVPTYPTGLDGFPGHPIPNGLDGATRKLDNRNSAIFVGGNINTYNRMPPKKPVNVSIRPSRPAPTSPAINSPMLPTNSSSPPLDGSMSENSSTERGEEPFFPHSGGESVNSGEGFTDDEQSPEFEGNSIANISSDFQSTLNNSVVESVTTNGEKENEFLSNNDAYNTHNKVKNEKEWKTPNQVRKDKLKSPGEIKEEEEQLVCF